MSLLQSVKRAVPEPIKRIAKRGTAESRLVAALSPHLPAVSCIDVGASYYPHLRWRILLESDQTHWTAVEPNVANIAYVNAWRWPSQVHAVTTGLSEHGGTQTLHITNVDSGSSLLPPVIAAGLSHRFRNLDYFFPVREVQIDTLTLAEVIERAPANAPVFVKLDTQGTELSILRGAERHIVLRRVVGIELEATLLAQPVMQGGGKLWEACAYLESHGFELLHIKPIAGPSRFGLQQPRGNTFLNECDAVFALRRDVASSQGTSVRVALCAFYVCNRLYEEAFSLLEDDAEARDKLAERGCNVVGSPGTELEFAL